MCSQQVFIFLHKFSNSVLSYSTACMQVRSFNSNGHMAFYNLSIYFDLMVNFEVDLAKWSNLNLKISGRKVVQLFQIRKSIEHVCWVLGNVSVGSVHCCIRFKKIFCSLRYSNCVLKKIIIVFSWRHAYHTTHTKCNIS